MTSCISHSDKSATRARRGSMRRLVRGVRYGIARMSFGRRIDLARRIREIGRKMEFLEAGERRAREAGGGGAGGGDRSGVSGVGTDGVEGLEIDGEAATPATLIEKGPADLATEILARIKAECGLSEDERKN